jgi:type 1 glutamine amidotransferase
MLAAPWLTGLVQAQPARKKVLFFTKSAGFQHSVVTRKGEELAHAERVLVEMGKSHGFDVEPTKDGGVFDKDLSGYDAFVFYTTGDLTRPGTDKSPPMTAEGKKALLDAIAAGKGFVGSHCASDTFHTPGPAFETQETKDPYIAMVGGEFIRHGAQQKATMTVVNPKFPGLAAAGQGFDMHEEWYSLKNFAPDLHVLLVNETTGMQGKDYQRPRFPATWARHHGKGRVFYTSMGHREDVWTNPTFQAIFVGGIHWATRAVDADIPANIDQVTPGANTLPPR